MKRYLIVVEETGTGYSAFSPDLPGCVATGSSPEQVEARMREAIGLHVDELRDQGLDVPDPRAFSSYVELPA